MAETSSSATEIAILGGGCAGLSLANALLERPDLEGPIRILEARQTYHRDRTFCGWHVERHAFEGAITHRWHRWSVRAGGRTVSCGSARHPYCEIPGDRFYAMALDRLEQDPRATLDLGVRTKSLAANDGGVTIETDRGALDAGLVFDSRPPGTATFDARPRATLWQHFVGLRIRTARPAFDPSTVTLMDFDVPQDRGIHFFYVLPYAADEALVEATWFSPHFLAEHEYVSAIRRYLDDRYRIDDFDVESTERGRIPMAALPPAPARPHVVPIGTAGGAVRPSTGYAFLSIQRQARAIARGLWPGHTPRVPARSRLVRALDAILLDHLDARAETAPLLFRDLFERANPDSLARFLMECARPRDLLSVMRGMPFETMCRQAVRSAIDGLRP